MFHPVFLTNQIKNNQKSKQVNKHQFDKKKIKNTFNNRNNLRLFLEEFRGYLAVHNQLTQLLPKVKKMKRILVHFTW